MIPVKDSENGGGLVKIGGAGSEELRTGGAIRKWVRLWADPGSAGTRSPYPLREAFCVRLRFIAA